MSDYQIPITIRSDSKGFYDRQCPNEECEYIFKINIDDWKEKVLDEIVYCPMCGYTASSDHWYTDAHVEEIHEITSNWAMSHIEGELDKVFSNFAKNTGNNEFFKITYKPGKKTTFINNPIGQREEWEVEITCDKCGTRYSVIGSAYFCPCCGYNAVENVFDDSLDTVEKMIHAKQEMYQTFSRMYGNNKAHTMCRSLMEGSLGDIVSAFQKFAESRFISLSDKKVRVNDFQIVEKGSSLFRDNCGEGYEEWLSDDENREMNLMFQRRHIYEHNNGIVDEKYIQNSGDTVYTIGQRLIVHDSDALHLLEIIRKLGNGLKSL